MALAKVVPPCVFGTGKLPGAGNLKSARLTSRYSRTPAKKIRVPLKEKDFTLKKSRCRRINQVVNALPRGQSIYHRKPSPLGASRKTRLFCARPTPFGPPNRQNFLREVADMPSKRKDRPCDSAPTDRRCRVCCNPRDKKPCQGPLQDRCPRPKPSLADPAAPLPPNPLPL